MSFEKISSLLESKSMIDINLISDSLKTTLNEIIDILSNHEKKMKTLEQRISEKAESSDIQKINGKLSDINLDTVNKLIEQSDSSFNSKLGDIENQMKEIEERVLQKVSEKFKEKEESSKQQFLTIDEDIQIANQKANTMIKSLGELKEKVDASSSEIAPIKDRITNLENNSDSTLANNLKKLEDKVNKLIEKSDNNIENLKTEIQNTKRDNVIVNDQNQKTFQSIHEKLIELNGRLSDSPGLEFDSSQPIDFNSIMRAIQRDSRRIDIMNEIVLKTQEESHGNTQFFSGLHSCLHEIGFSVTKLAQELTQLKTDLPEWLDSKVGDTNEVTALANDLAKRFKESEINSGQAFTEISDSINHITSLLKTKLPNSKETGLIDAINTCEKNGEELKFMIASFNKNTKKMNNDIFKCQNIPEIKIPALPTEDKSEKEEIEIRENEFESEMREKLENLTKLVNEHVESSKANQLIVSAELDKKADLYVMERMIEKLKNLIGNISNKAMEQANHQQQQHIQMNHQHQKRNKENLDISGDKLTLNKSFTRPHKMSQSAFAQPLPPLPTSAQAYDVIYNQKRITRE